MDRTEQAQQIPEQYIELCKEIGTLAKKHGLQRISGKFDDSSFYGSKSKEPWSGEIQFSWEQGRHGADSDKINLQAHVRLTTNISEDGLKLGHWPG